MAILLTLFSFGLYFPVWFGQTWSELKRVVHDPGMSPVGHALSLFVPIYNLIRVHAHFRTINAQSALRGLPREMAPGLSVAGVLLAILLGGAARRLSDAYAILALVVEISATLLLVAIVVAGQIELNRVWDHDFETAAERKSSTGEWIALLGLGIFFALVLFGALVVSFPPPTR